MKFIELKEEIIALGFDASVGSDDLLVYSANRALRDIYMRRKILTTVRLFAVGHTPSTYIQAIECVNGKSITLPFTGRAYSMRLCGTGFYKIKTNLNEVITPFETGYESKHVRGFINGKGETITFYGSMSFTVYDFSLFDEIYTPNAKDIPDGAATVSFNIREMYGDFMSFVGPARDVYGKEIKNSRLTDGRVELPSGYRGEVELTYRRLPAPIENSDDYIIDIPDEYSYVLPLLMAFYVWLDVDENKALYYKKEYERMMQTLESESYQELDNSYVNTNGWA